MNWSLYNNGMATLSWLNILLLPLILIDINTPPGFLLLCVSIVYVSILFYF